ncbi:hypothetical protein AB0I81_34990 [Nonomuraea sp. NPDC050404]|uniref:hypothetical protein n=1 Tax=Nonomuraea sp. NPDC050404 TaxID=3155783 RepID=UPI0033C7BED0
MAITILDYVAAKVGIRESYTAVDHLSNGVHFLGGCECCHASIASYNAHPAQSGSWRCADCVGDSGYLTVAEFEADTY